MIMYLIQTINKVPICSDQVLRHNEVRSGFMFLLSNSTGMISIDLPKHVYTGMESGFLV